MHRIKTSLALAIALTLAASAFAQTPEIIEAAEKGNVSAQIKLGYGFRDGSYGKKDNQKAFEWFSKAAATNNPEALDNLGWLVEKGIGTAADGAKARELYRKAADQKHVLAINNLARCFRDGVGGAADVKEAQKWSMFAFEGYPGAKSALEAAEKGDVSAQIKLGYGFRDGKFGKKDNQKAFEWFSKAAATNNPEALDNLGWLAEKGMGTSANGAKARELYRKAADQKHVLGINNLARCFRDGVGGAADAKEALKWSMFAFETNPGPETANPLAMALLNEPSLTPHRALIDRLATVMSHKVLKNVARIYHEGSGGIEKNPQRVRELFAAARTHGMPAELLDADQLDGLAKRPRVTGQFAYQPTHHLDQGYNMCAPTSAAMGLEFYLRKPVDPYAIKKNSEGQSQPGTGTAWDCMMHGIKSVSGHDWEFRSWPNNDAGFDAGLPMLLAELDAGRIALIDLGPHTVVLSGYDAGKQVVYINNPAYGWPGIHTVSYTDLRKKWHSPWHVTTTKGVEARPVLLTADSAKKSVR